MWQLQGHWYELVIRASTIFAFLFIVFRLWGKKHMGEIAAFDLLLMLLMSEAVQNSLVDDDKSITAGMIVITTLIVLNIIMGRLSYRSRKLERILDGEPIDLIRNGRIIEEVLKKEKMTTQQLLECIREEGVESVKQVKRATLESNGKISVIKKSEEVPGETHLFERIREKIHHSGSKT